MAKTCKKSYRPKRKCVKRRKRYGVSCKRPLKVKICRTRRKTFRNKNSLRKKVKCGQMLNRTLKLRYDLEVPESTQTYLTDLQYRFGFSHSSLRDRIKTTLADNTSTATVPVFGWNDIPQQVDFLKYFKKLRLKKIKIKWFPAPELKAGVGLEHSDASGNIPKLVPGIGRMYVYETKDVFTDIGLKEDKIHHRAQASFDITKPFEITRDLARTYVNPSVFSVMAHDRTVNAFMDPSKYLQEVSGVKGTIGGLAQMKRYCEAYGAAMPQGFVFHCNLKNMPRQLRLGHFETSYSYTLTGLHEDLQAVKDHISLGQVSGNLVPTLNNVSLTALGTLLGIGSVAVATADMFKAIPVMEAAYKSDIQTVATAAATAGGFALIDAADVTALTRHLTTYFT